MSQSESENHSVQTLGCRRLVPLDWNPISVLKQDGHTLASAAQSDVSPSLRLSLGSSGCFVRRYAVYCDEAAHVVEPWRNDAERKAKTEYILRQLGVVPKNFTLEDVMNLQWLTPEWHKGMNKWGMWTWALSPVSLERVISWLTAERQRRQDEYDEDGVGCARWREWDPSWCQSNMEYDILILNPNGLMGSDPVPLLRLDNGYFQLYFPGPDGHLHRPSGQPLLPFAVDRSPGAPLNPCHAFSSLDKLEAHRSALKSQNIPASTSPHDSYYHQLRRLIEELYERLEPPTEERLRARNLSIPAPFIGVTQSLNNWNRTRRHAATNSAQADQIDHPSPPRQAEYAVQEHRARRCRKRSSL
ncbi:hypothetical protein DFH06DRAFT_1215943 [Mycena polygramma]|nr:hypothetical protein DFH06DRAFT_1215943 [Mycena polygramma]